MIRLYEHQKKAIEALDSGKILCGGVGSGKSLTSLCYYILKECDGSIPDGREFTGMKNPHDLVIITTARKRDTLEWERECTPLFLSRSPESNPNHVSVTVDSWNNIHKYRNVENAFFIFDEQRVVGSGKWVESFLAITKKNRWILLSATPGDTWVDYIPVFIANGFYKNRTEFMREHVIFSRFSKYPKIDRYMNCKRLIRQRDSILVRMRFERATVSHHEHVNVTYDRELYRECFQRRWNPYKNEPAADAGGMCYILRRIVNAHESRLEAVRMLLRMHPKAIIFYNYDYELEALMSLKSDELQVTQWNGHKHEQIPKSDRWAYLVQYNAGAEGWNCIETDTLIFSSQNYSYKAMIQAAGRIDRMNTPFRDLYYYHLKSSAPIDIAIGRALNQKKNFNENAFIGKTAFA